MPFIDSTPLSVLLIEDNPGDARLVEHYLREMGTTSSPPSLTHVERLDALPDPSEHDSFDIALLDLGLPESSGIETVDRYLAREPAHPVVVLTGFDDDEMSVAAIQHGAQDYIPKADLDADRLGRTIRYAIERHHQERELERKNDRLEEFANVVSHDLRNPLNVALGRLELHNEECESEQVAVVERNLHRMGAIIDDVLTLARQGDDISDPETVDMSDVVENAWACVETDGATLTIETPLPSVEADPSRLQQLFENLFRNSVEHGRAGADDRPTAGGDDSDTHPPAVDVRVGVLDEGDGFYVDDDGPGIPSRVRERVFDAGYSTAPSGTGFGLPIVKQIAEAHGWVVSVQPTASERGTRFDFRAREPARETQAAKAVHDSERDGAV